jgi:hypothetical protein
VYRTDTPERTHFMTTAYKEELRQAVVLHLIDDKSSTTVAVAAANIEGCEARDNHDEETLDAQHSDGEDFLLTMIQKNCRRTTVRNCST